MVSLPPTGAAIDDAVAVETVHAATVCSGAPRIPQAIWIDSAQVLNRHWQRMLSHRVGGENRPVPRIEWETHGMVLIHMGHKTTGGYRLESTQSKARLKAGSAWIAIDWIEPPTGAIAAQVITQPCLLLKIQRGEYRSVVIADQSGRQRAKADLPQ